MHGLLGSLGLPASLPALKPIGMVPNIDPKLYMVPSVKGHTVQELQLSGGCDWYKIERLAQAEDRVISLLREYNLDQFATKLLSMRNDVIAHRMGMSPYESPVGFLKNNCGNDLYLYKWRHGTDCSILHPSIPFKFFVDSLINCDGGCHVKLLQLKANRYDCQN
jgi:hypothetical protein